MLNADGLLGRGIVRRRQSTHGSSRIADEPPVIEENYLFRGFDRHGREMVLVTRRQFVQPTVFAAGVLYFYRQEHEAAFDETVLSKLVARGSSIE